MGDMNYETRRAKKHGMSLEEWLSKKSRTKVTEPTPVISDVYHHTNILVSHLIWSSGVVDLEREDALIVPHPSFGTIGFAGVNMRRKARDFPRMAWFTSNKAIPKCLDNGELNQVELFKDFTPAQINATKLNRIAIEFPLADTPQIIPWVSHAGYGTNEGRKLNRDARDVGDEPDEWYVSETPVFIDTMTKVLLATNWLNPLWNGEMDVNAIKLNSQVAKAAGVELPPDWQLPSWQKQYGKHFGS